MRGSQRQNHASSSVLGPSSGASSPSSIGAPSPARVTLPSDLSGSQAYGILIPDAAEEKPMGVTSSRSDLAPSARVLGPLTRTDKILKMEGIVIDTNVFVAAGFNPRSASARVLAAVRNERFHLIWNQSTRREIEMILRRIPRFNWEEVANLFERSKYNWDRRARAARLPGTSGRGYQRIAGGRNRPFGQRQTRCQRAGNHRRIPKTSTGQTPTPIRPNHTPSRKTTAPPATTCTIVLPNGLFIKRKRINAIAVSSNATTT